MFRLPDLSSLGVLVDPKLAHNSHRERWDRPVPLNLEQLGRVLPLLQDDGPKDGRELFLVAAQFYARALRDAERAAEVAYLHLVAVGEIIAELVDLDRDALIDDELRSILDSIRTHCPEGEQLATRVRRRTYQLKRGFVEAQASLVEPTFYRPAQGEGSIKGRLTPDNLRQAIGAAYDLRSRYLHAGKQFGTWSSMRLWEVPFGRPGVDDRDLAQILERAPSFIGLERLVRHCLLGLAELKGWLLPAI